MKIIEATWEKRNLGVDGCEFHIELHDEIENVFPIIDNYYMEYQVMRIPCGNTSVLLEAQKKGFEFIEMSIHLQKNMSEVYVPDMYRRFMPYLSFEYANEEEKRNVLEIVREKEMFVTDKVARDPYFGSKKAGIRYSYWLEEILNTKGKLLIVRYKDIKVGFDVCVDKGNGVVEAVLGGVFPEYENKGLGFAPIYLLLKSAQNTDVKKMVVTVSSNNMAILRLHEAFGFRIESMSYVLFKHI